MLAARVKYQNPDVRVGLLRHVRKMVAVIAVESVAKHDHVKLVLENRLFDLSPAKRKLD